MKRKAILLLFTIIIISNIYATDFAVSVTPGTLISGNTYQPGAHVSVGGKIGISPTIEISADAIFELVPNAFGSFKYNILAGYDILGPRYFENGQAGFAVNSIIWVGLAGINRILPDTVLLKMSPVTIGMIAQGKRENLFPIGIGYNFIDREFCFWVSVITYDFYL